MKKLKEELRFNENNVQLKDNLVKGSILPEKVAELNRTITIQADTVIEGAVYAHKMEIQNGDVEVHGAVFTQLELYVNSEAGGSVSFMKSVGSANSVVSRAQNCQLTFHADVNAKSITLYNAFVAGSLYADEIILKNCVVIGGVFATQSLEMDNSIVGTFNAPSVTIAEQVSLLLPSAFSIEKVRALAGTRLYNLSLADLGALYKGEAEAPESGRIEIDIETDEVKSVLTDDETQKNLRSYTVVGKVLAADLLDMDKFQNHFLLVAASLGPQLLKTYDFGIDDKGNPIPLSFDRIRDFFFRLLSGEVRVKEIDGTFSIAEITGQM